MARKLLILLGTLLLLALVKFLWAMWRVPSYTEAPE